MINKQQNIFIIPLTQIHFSDNDFIVIGARPQMGRTKYAIHWLKKYAAEEIAPCFIFIDVKEKNIRKNVTPDVMEKVKPHFYQFGDEDKFIQEIEALYIAQPPFIYIQGFEKFFRIYSHKESIRFHVEEILIRVKLLTEKYKIPTIVTTHLHASDPEGLPYYHPQLKDFRSTTMEIIASQILILHRLSFYGFLTNIDGQDITNVTEIIHLKGNGAGDQKVYRFITMEDGMRLCPAPLGLLK